MKYLEKIYDHYHCRGWQRALAGERRVALVPETAKKFTGLGAHIRMEQGAGKHSQFQDNEYLDVPTAANLAQPTGNTP